MSSADHLGDVGEQHHPGQGVGLVDIAVNGDATGAFVAFHGETGARAFAERLSASAHVSHGAAGPAFVERLVTSKLTARAIFVAFDRIRSRYAADLELSDDLQLQHALDRFALAALAGEMATKMGLTGWRAGAALDGILCMARHWSKARERDTQSVCEARLERTRAYLVDSGTDHLAEMSDTATVPREGWFDAEAVYFCKDAWQRIHGEDATEAARDLRKAGALKVNEGDSLMYRLPRSVPGRPRTYAVLRKALGIGDMPPARRTLLGE